jgi:hypothetical protein
VGGFDDRISVADPYPGRTMKNPGHISESLETINGVKILEFFYADPVSGIEKSHPA